MAGIDHTIIAFHNGKLMRNEVKVEVDQYTSLIPFQYTRDGELYGVDFDKKIEIPQYYSITATTNLATGLFANLAHS